MHRYGFKAWNRLFGWRRRAEARATMQHAIDYLPSGSRVLDIGSGQGYVLDVLNEEMACTAFGCDVVMPTAAENRFTLFDGSRLPFRDGAFDVAFLVFVLHHANEPGELLREASRVATQSVVVVEDTPSTALEEEWGRMHIRSFARRHHIPWHGRVRREHEWRHIFQFSGMPVLHVERLGRLERLPPVARTVFVLEPARAAAAQPVARAATS